MDDNRDRWLSPQTFWDLVPGLSMEETSPPLRASVRPPLPRSIGSFFMFIIYTPPLTVDVACRCVCYAVRTCIRPATESGVISLLSFLLLPLLLALSTRLVGFLCTKRFVMAGSPEKSLLKPPRTELTLVSIRLRLARCKQKHRPCDAACWSLLFCLLYGLARLTGFGSFTECDILYWLDGLFSVPLYHSALRESILAQEER